MGLEKSSKSINFTPRKPSPFSFTEMGLFVCKESILGVRLNAGHFSILNRKKSFNEEGNAENLLQYTSYC